MNKTNSTVKDPFSPYLAYMIFLLLNMKIRSNRHGHVW